MSSKQYPDFYDFVDIDPYGSAVSFLSSAFHAASNESMVAITCTDMRVPSSTYQVLAGSDNHKCFYLYGAVRSRIPCFEEHALRIALATINRIANEQKKAIVPLLSVQKNFYLRIFVRVSNSKSDCWSSIQKTGMIYYCTQCSNSHVERLGHYDEKRKTFMPNRVTLPSVKCNLCGGSWVMNGPLWLDPINDIGFIRDTLHNFDALKQHDTSSPNWDYLKNLRITKFDEIHGVLGGAAQEEEVQDIPITWDFSHLFGFVKVGAPKNDII
jgi:tRNA (guanine26-N2/guanine27-N2)-dimethyltransferase